jgi:hypothetical protein
MNKQQLADFAKDLGSHFAKVSDAHDALALTFDDSSQEFAAHKAISASSADMAGKCLTCLKVLVAADDDEMDKRDYSQLVPTGISAIAPTAPRAIPRHGAPPVSAAAADDSGMFAKIFGGIDDEEA